MGLVLAEAAEIDDLRDARPIGLGGDVLGRSAIELGEVARAERVDEVVGDVDAVERAADRAGDVGGERAHPGHVGGGAPPRDGDDLASLRQHRHERAADEPGRSDDCGSHGVTSPAWLAVGSDIAIAPCERGDERGLGDRVAGEHEHAVGLQGRRSPRRRRRAPGGGGRRAARSWFDDRLHALAGRPR